MNKLNFFNQNGYCIVKLFTLADINLLKKNIEKRINYLAKNKIIPKNWKLKDLL